jgi:hypothetical protein
LAGINHGRLGEVFSLANLLNRWPGKNGKGDAFPTAEARAAAATFDLSGYDVVVMIGRNVAQAFNVKNIDYFEMFTFSVVMAVGCYVDGYEPGDQSPCFPCPVIPAQLQGRMGKGLGPGCGTFRNITVFVVPHPSGVNRWWNDAANEARARTFMERMVSFARTS